MDSRYRKAYQGLTLVELLVSLVIASILAIMVTNGFLFIKKCMLTQQALVRMQVNARTLDYLLGKAIRNSGVFGCYKLQSQSVIVTEKDIDLHDYGILASKGIISISLQQLPTRVQKRYKTDSEILWIQSGNPIFSNSRIKKGSILTLSDCQQVTFLRMNDIDNLDVRDPFTLSVLSSTLYYVADTKRTNAKGNSIYALYSTDLNGRTLELVEGVEKMEFTFASLIQGEVVYLKAHEVSDWHSIVSIRLKVLLNTIEDTEPLIRKWWYYEWSLM